MPEANKLSPHDITDQIIDVDYHVFKNTTLTVCCIRLKNGYSVTGESACVSVENLNAQQGRELAFEQAKQKIWQLEGYVLRNALHAQGRQ